MKRFRIFILKLNVDLSGVVFIKCGNIVCNLHHCKFLILFNNKNE